jgi:ATP-dependent DNA helicase PIF1
MDAYKTIMSTIDSPNGGIFFIDGPGGTEKTFLYRALLGIVRSQDKIVVTTTTSGYFYYAWWINCTLPL